MANSGMVLLTLLTNRGAAVTRLAELIDLYNDQDLEPGEPPMTIRRLAEVSGIAERTVYRHFNGETSISLEQGMAYAQALKRPLEQLAEGVA